MIPSALHWRRRRALAVTDHAALHGVRCSRCQSTTTYLGNSIFHNLKLLIVISASSLQCRPDLQTMEGRIPFNQTVSLMQLSILWQGRSSKDMYSTWEVIRGKILKGASNFVAQESGKIADYSQSCRIHSNLLPDDSPTFFNYHTWKITPLLLPSARWVRTMETALLNRSNHF